MARALSVDLRQRVVATIDGGMSCRQAAERFGVSAASAIRWRGRLKEVGDIVPKRQGGDRKSKRIEAHSAIDSGRGDSEAGYHARRVARTVETSWNIDWHRVALAFFPAQKDHT
ncbi:transposase [Bradyrhizobium elkanii]|nr:transposase [Bradyrhizobium elkanii]